MTINYQKNYDLIEEFIIESGISSDVLQFATDYMGLSDGMDAVIDYYDLADELEEYLTQCGIEY
ncbi:MAG: hypothetical protein J6S85_09830 [Methanobrevibacter sp.]|nr:hypothetical protein [Methanobrevibacter sp.]